MTVGAIGKLGVAGPILVRPFLPYLDNPGVVPEGLGGISVVHLVTGLLERGWHVSVYTLDPTVRDEVVLRGEQLRIFIGPCRSRHCARDYFRAERHYVAHAIEVDEPDLVHAHWTYEFALGALKTRHKCPVLVTARDAPYRILWYTPDAYRVVRLVMAQDVALRTRHLTVASPYMAEHWRRYLFYRRPIRVIPNGLPGHVFSRVAQRSMRSGRALVFAAVLNGWGKLKNGTTLLSAFHLVRREFPAARLLLIGPGHGLNEAGHCWALERGLTEGVEFAGVLHNEAVLDRLAQEASVLVHPALEESFGNSVLEGMALALPVIGGRAAGAVPYLLDEGNAGVLADVTSFEPLAHAMLELVRDPGRAEKVGRAGYERARSVFHIDRVLDGYIEEYLGASKE